MAESISPTPGTPPQPSIARPDAPSELREQARNARRIALLEVAEQVFAERGFAGATMAEIAKRAGYSAGNLYNVFEGKDALFAEVMASRADQVLEQVRAALRSGDALGQVIDGYLDATLQLVEQHRGFFVMITQTSPDFDWHAAQEDSPDGGLRGELDSQLEHVFQSAMDRGEIPQGDPRSYASMLNGTLNAHIAHWVRHGGTREDLWGQAEQLRQLLRRGLGVESRLN